jgi:8-oxo-dGTP pyrophosphatase MutT (NUDIX family)
MLFTASRIDQLMVADDLPKQLAHAFEQGRRGQRLPARMSPEMSYGRHAGPAPMTARAAAVLLFLFRRSGCWHLPLTLRPASLMRHGGQVSLPGGVVDVGESSANAALRELNEELGVDADVELLGRLADCYVFASDFLITPWVCSIDFEPQWRPHVSEVQGVVELPLNALFDQHSFGTTTIERGPLKFRAPCLHVGSACVWGATAVILSELADVLSSILPAMQAAPPS